MIKVVYSREIAVKEGFRENVEIDKGYFKRPVIKHTYNDYKARDFHKTREDILNSVTRIVNGEVKRSFSIGTMILNNLNSNLRKMINKTYDKSKKLNVKEVVEIGNFKNRTMYVYIEKQNGTVYSVRNMEGINKDQVYEIDLGKYYDIAGKLVFINLNKKNGAYKVNQIIKVLD